MLTSSPPPMTMPPQPEPEPKSKPCAVDYSSELKQGYKTLDACRADPCALGVRFCVGYYKTDAVAYGQYIEEGAEGRCGTCEGDCEWDCTELSCLKTSETVFYTVDYDGVRIVHMEVRDKCDCVSFD